MNKRFVSMLLAGAVVAGIGGGAWGQVRMVPHSDTQWAHELLQLNQASLIKAQEEANQGTVAENLWKAQKIVVTWDEFVKEGETVRGAVEYLAAMNACMEANPEVDGVWALDHAKFIYGQLSQRIVTRMENWVNSAKDRALLEPMAKLGSELLEKAAGSLDAAVRYYESRNPFDENAYTRVSTAQAEGQYYNVWGQYFLAMSMEPGLKAVRERKERLQKGAEALAQWADDETDNGVNHQALLLRGKIRSEMGGTGDLRQAKLDFDKAMLPVKNDDGGTTAPPAWVVYQARYQKIVTQIRERDFASALSAFEAFKNTLPKDNKVAMMSAEMLRYRIVWAESETKEGADKKAGQLKAMGILSEIIKIEPGFRDLIYEQLGTQIPDGAEMSDMLPLQQMAIAHAKSLGQRGDTDESKAALREAVKAAVAVKENKSSTDAEKLEGLYLAGVCSAVLNDIVPAIRYNVEFARVAPVTDERSKRLLDLAMGQIGELKKMHPNEASSPQMMAVVEEALRLSVEKFKENKNAFFLAISLLQSNKLDEAARAFARVPTTDPKYIDSQHGLVSIATARFGELSGSGAAQADVQRAANDLFRTCGNFVSLLDKPPVNTPKESLDRFRAFRTDILLVEATTALNPAVNDAKKAMERIDKLYENRGEMSPRMQGTVLRLKIQALQAIGRTDEIMTAVQEYAKAVGKDPVEIITAMAFSTLEEVTKLENVESAEAKAQAKKLADFVVKLFDPIIADKTRAGDKKAVFDLRAVKAHMMVLAGDYQGSQALCKALQEEIPSQLSPFLTEARGMYLQAKDTRDNQKYKETLDYFTRILPRLQPGNDSYWESWLRIIQCIEALKGESAARDEIRQKLRDLRSTSETGLGGEMYKQEYDKLVIKYGA